MPKTDAVLPLAGRDGEPHFEEPWQAQTLAVAAKLVDTGMIAGARWSEALGQEIRNASGRGEPDNARTYYVCALKALERLSGELDLVSAQELKEREQAWADAFLATPHGQPVVLPDRISKSP